MDITTLAAWGEFIGGIAVVVSLIYLASQIRQNSRLLEVSTIAAIGGRQLEVLKAFVQEPARQRIHREGLADLAALSVEDRDIFNGYHHMALHAIQNNYFISKRGSLDSALWQGERRGYALLFRQPGAQKWWTENRQVFSDEFADFYDDLIREGEAAG